MRSRAGLLLRRHHGARRLPAPRGRDARQVGARGPAGHGHRRAGSGDRRAVRALRDPQDLRGSPLAGRRHRQPHAHRRPDRRRHQHQRGAGQGHVPDRPPHHPRGERRRGRGNADAADRRSGGQVAGSRLRRAAHPARGSLRADTGSGKARRADRAPRDRDHGRAGHAARRADLHRCAPLLDRGVPTVVYGAGPHTLLEANGHRADERLRLDDLYKATRVVALALADLLER